MLKRFSLIVVLVTASFGHAAPAPMSLERAIEVLNSDYRLSKEPAAFNAGISSGLQITKLGGLMVALDVVTRLLYVPNARLAPWGPLSTYATGRLAQVGVSVMVTGSLLATGGVVFEGISRLRHRPTDDERIRADLGHYFSLSRRRQLQLAQNDPELADVVIRLAGLMTDERTPNVITPVGVATLPVH